jgi:hypothetical protein
MLTRAKLRVLRVLDEASEPLFNGDLGARTGLVFNSRLFRALERDGLIKGRHPYELTDAGRAALTKARQGVS